jgi:hypothetical protein
LICFPDAVFKFHGIPLVSNRYSLFDNPSIRVSRNDQPRPAANQQLFKKGVKLSLGQSSLRAGFRGNGQFTLPFFAKIVIFFIMELPACPRKGLLVTVNGLEYQTSFVMR